MSFLTDAILGGTDWRAVERAFARIATHLGWQDVMVVGRPGDAGGDVICVVREHGISKVFVIQVRATSGSSYVGPEKLQQVLDALTYYGGDVGLVATNGEFTQSARRREAVLKNEGYDIRLWNGQFLKKLYSAMPVLSVARRELRHEYQTEVVARCLDKYRGGGNKASIIVATGLGKSTIAAEVLRQLFDNGLSTALVLCHTRPLALQLEQSFWAQLPKTIATRVFFDGMPPKMSNGVEFGTYQTLLGYLSGVEPTAYDMVVVDEAHHALASGFARVINHLKPRFLLGMTATPWRGDGLPMEMLFGNALARISIVDGMKMGFLAHVDYRVFSDTIDWTHIERHTSGKLRVSDLNKRLFIPQRDEAVIDSVNATAREIKNPRIIVFCSSIEHARRFTALMNLSSKLKCAELSGVERVEQNRRLMQFAGGKIQVVTAVDVLNEGIDVPDVNMIVFLRPTHSRRIFIQQLGRGLRVSPKTGKNCVIVLDFVTDIRRLADAAAIDHEAQRGGSEFASFVFDKSMIRFECRNTQTFVEQWLRDVSDLGDAEDSALLEFPAP